MSEKEVDADKVTWPIVSKELGNDLPDLYHRIAVTQASIKRFLKAGGVADSEITVNAPVVIDLNADQYSDNRRSYRYNITSIITVTSRNVAQVRNLIARQGELLKDGIAIVSGDYENRIRYEYVSFKALHKHTKAPHQHGGNDKQHNGTDKSRHYHILGKTGMNLNLMQQAHTNSCYCCGICHTMKVNKTRITHHAMIGVEYEKRDYVYHKAD